MMLLLLACGTREIPAHLQSVPTVAPAAHTTPASLDQAIAELLGSDPLLRRPPLERAQGWPELDPHLSAWITAARDTPSEPAAFQALERNHQGTVAVPLARGWRLAAVEPTASTLQGDLNLERQAGLWLSSFRASGVSPRDQGPWGWLGAGSVLEYGEQWVLRGWLSHPDLSVDALRLALTDSHYGRLADSPEGQILLAPRAPAPADMSSLDELVTLVLQGAAADRDSEQRSHREQLEALGVRLESPNQPLLVLAARTRTGLVELGGAQGRGGALLAWQVERWLAPERGPGLDRSETLAGLPLWHPSLAAPAALVQVAWLKEVSDRLEVGLKRGRTYSVMPWLGDVLQGAGQGGLPVRWLERSGTEPATWLDLTRAAGAPDGTTPTEGLAALKGLLSQHCTQALAMKLSGPQREAVGRIQARADR